MKQDRELVGTKYNERGRERARFKGYVVECICLTNDWFGHNVEKRLSPCCIVKNGCKVFEIYSERRCCTRDPCD